MPHFMLLAGTRQLFAIKVEGVQTSRDCGVPILRRERGRDTRGLHPGASERLAKWRGGDASIGGVPVSMPTATPGAC